MLKNFTWNMTGYVPKYPVDSSADGIRPYIAERIFQAEPDPPKMDNSNEYILSALSEQNLLYFSFFFHYYEPQLNKRIKPFLGVENGEGYNADCFLDIKLDCREIMLQKLTNYDPSKGAEFATYIYPFIRDAILRFRMSEEKWSVSSLTSYKMLRSMAYLYHNTQDAVGKLALNFEAKIAEIEKLADWDTIKSHKYAKVAISYLLHCKSEDLPKDIVIPFEP